MDVGLMVIDTSRPGWTVLHADCNSAAIDSKQGEGQSLWDLFKVPDVVCYPPEALQLCSMHQQSFSCTRYAQYVYAEVLDNMSCCFKLNPGAVVWQWYARSDVVFD